jgi:hypothetical protein
MPHVHAGKKMRGGDYLTPLDKKKQKADAERGLLLAEDLPENVKVRVRRSKKMH